MEDVVNSGLSLFTIWGMRVLSAGMILVAGWMIGNYLRKTIHNFDKLDDTLESFLGNFAKYTVFFVAIIAVLGQFGVQTASLLALLGAAGLAIGLALQGTLSNVASGVMLLMLRPFNVGDFIEAGSVSGTVKDLGLFTTEFATSDNIYISAPNSQIWSSEIKNYSRNKQRRKDLIIGISYDDDINKAMKTIEKVLAKEKRIVATAGKEPVVAVMNLGDFSVDITVRYWSASSDFWTTQWDLTKAIKEALDKDGISIPFPTTTIEYAKGSEPAKKAA